MSLKLATVFGCAAIPYPLSRMNVAHRDSSTVYCLLHVNLCLSPRVLRVLEMFSKSTQAHLEVTSDSRWKMGRE